MPLPLSPPVLPQLARPGADLPDGEGWLYEPKWDGFRAIAFVDGDDFHVQSRNGKPLNRYFPELRFPAGRYVLDGELVIRTPSGGENFEALQERIHPAASRVAMLAEKTPATYVAFDILALDDESLIDRPFAERRRILEKHVSDPVELTPATDSPKGAEKWLHGAEGVIAKRVDAPYLPGERKGMIKVRRTRTIDAVVIGWRPGKAEGTVGSLILALYDGDNLWPVGHTSGFTAKRARELVGVVTPYETGESGMNEPNRWNAGKEDREWRGLRPELVVEVTFDHTSNNRIRHGTKVLRWRDDKAPADCKTDQLAG